MKILIMGFSKVKYMPYINFYIDNIDMHKNEVHILHWNRDLQDEDLSKYENCSFHEFSQYQEDDVPKATKIFNFVKYRRLAVDLIKKENFDFIVVLHSLTGVLIADELKRHYTGRFIFDYRDFTYENFTPYKRIIAELVLHSAATFVSSDAYRQFLPADCKNKIFTSHNLLKDSLNHRNEKAEHGISSDKIRIGFWGFIRHEEVNREIIKKTTKDKRFELHYYGREQQVALNLKAYASELNAVNVFFHGEYTPEQRYEFVRRTDIVHNIYEDPNMLCAVSNKYYDGVVFKIPQLCMNGSFMAEKCIKSGVGLQCDPFDDDFLDKVFCFYSKLEQSDFDERCDAELYRVLDQINEGETALNMLFSKEYI